MPTDKKELQRVIGLFAYYAKWIEKYSEKIKPLNQATNFPLDAKASQAFAVLKTELATVSLQPIDENTPFVVETDASDNAVSGILHQNRKPVAFFSRTLQKGEKDLHSVEKEAMAIIDSVRNWRHLLSSSHFTLVTDQRSVSFMFDITSSNKI